MKKKAIALVSLFILCLCGCARTLRCGGAVSNEAGITAELTRCTVTVNKLGSSIFEPEIRITNNGDTALTSLSYEIDVLDKAGAVLYTAQGKYVQNESPLTKGESASVARGFQRVLDGKAASVQLRITDFTDETEQPALHVPQAGEYLYQALRNGCFAGIGENPPVAAEIVIDHSGAQETAYVTDPETIAALVDAFTDVKIGEEPGEFVTDNYNSLWFTFADGTEAGISLNLKDLELNLNGEYYSFTLDGFGPLWNLMNELAEFDEESVGGGS